MKKLVLLVTLLFVLVSCGGNPSPQTPTGSKEFKIMLNAQPTGLNPLTTNDSMSSDISMQIFESLYERSASGTEYVPMLAAALPECSEDGLSCNIKLREGVKFTDGSPFGADSVIYTINKIKDKDYGSARPSIAASIVSIDKVSDHEVKLNLSYPDGVLVAKLAHMNSAIVSSTSEGVDLMTKPFGTGPYKLASMVAGSEYVLEVNPEYWGDKPEIEKVVYTVVPEISTAISRLETGEGDFLPIIPVTNVSRVKSLPNVEFVSAASSQITYMGMRTDTAKNAKLMTNLKARQAIAKAIDRVAYVESLEGNAKGLNSILPETVYGFKPEAQKYGYDYDFEGAKQLVVDEGFAAEPITILTNTRSEMSMLAEYIQSALNKIGFTNVTIVAEEFATYLDSAKKPNGFDLVLLTWANVTGDGTEFFDPNVHSVKSSQRVQYTNPAFDKLVDESRETVDQAVRLEKLNAANQLILDEAVLVAMYNTNNLFAHTKGFTNVDVIPGGIFYVKYFKIAK